MWFLYTTWKSGVRFSHLWEKQKQEWRAYRSPKGADAHLPGKTPVWANMAVVGGFHPPRRPPEAGFTKASFLSIYRSYTSSIQKMWEGQHSRNKRLLQISTTQKLTPWPFQQISFRSSIFAGMFCSRKWNNTGVVLCCSRILSLTKGFSPFPHSGHCLACLSHFQGDKGKTASMGGGYFLGLAPGGKPHISSKPLTSGFNPRLLNMSN